MADYFDSTDGKFYLFHLTAQIDNYDDTQCRNEATREKTIADEHGTIITLRIEPIPYSKSEIIDALPLQNVGFPNNLLSLANVSLLLQRADGSLNDMEEYDQSLGDVDDRQHSSIHVHEYGAICNR